MSINPADEIGNWKKEKVLGSGGFGYVILWRNKVTNETIALKECRWGHDPMMTPKHRQRWKLEVDMMFRLSHPNVVKAIPVPPELDVPATEMPLLAMEYCSNGDLRKLLNRPENCCGLKEKNVRLIMKHISSAVNYLHSIKIIHRDLKPENIVIQEENGNIVYKLIDLGYAKELDQGSLCTSFVGTVQYLAPELFMSQMYSCTVDYWSLGLVTHEIITGSRPFLPDKFPAEWIPIIKEKKPTEIRAYLDADKNIVFSDEISPFHHISSCFKKDVEQWLQIMLEWDARKRGRHESTTTFHHLNSILQKKIILVFCVDSFRTHSFFVTDSLALEEFYGMLEKESGIPVSEQELLFPDGRPPNSERGAIQFASNMEEDETLVLLFDKRDSHVPASPSSTNIPAAVETMMRNPRTQCSYQEQRVAWSQAVYVSQQEVGIVGRLVKGFKSSLMHLLTKTTYSHKSISRMTAEMNKLLAKCAFFQNSLDQDIKSYEHQAQNGGFTSENLYQDWKNTADNLKKVDILRQKIVNLEASTSRSSNHTLELQRSPYARSKLNTPLEEVHENILESFGVLRRRPSDKRKIHHDNTDIVRLLCLCLQHSHTQTQDVMNHIRRIKQIRRDIDECLPQIANLLKEITDWDAQVDHWQNKRQRALWKVMGVLHEKAHLAGRSVSPVVLGSSPQSRRTSLPQTLNPLRGSPDPGSKPGLQDSSKLSTLLKTPPIITPHAWQNRLESLALNSSFSSEDDFEGRRRLSSSASSSVFSLSSILDRTSEDSRRVKKENENLVASFQSMMDVLKSFQDTYTDLHENGNSTESTIEQRGPMS